MVECNILAVHFVLITELYEMHYFKYPTMILLRTLAWSMSSFQTLAINIAANVSLLFYFFHKRIVYLLVNILTYGRLTELKNSDD